MEKLKRRKYQILIMIMVLVIGIIGINKIGKIDRNKGKINIENAYVNKVSANINELLEVGKIQSTDKVEYEVKYKIDGEEKRNIQIKVSLSEEESKYAEIEKIKEENIESVLSEDRKEITIKVKEVEPNKENKIKIIINVKNAPNGYKISPEVQIKEETKEEYKKITTKELEVETISITGVVRDTTKNGVKDVELKLVDEKGKEIKRTYTDKDGRYTFSDIEDGKYKVEVEEERYVIEGNNIIDTKENEVLDIQIREEEPFKIEVKKYIKKLRINNEEYTYGEIEKVQQSIKGIKEISGEIEYKVEVRNKGNKEGVITRVEEEIDEGLEFKENNGWKLKNGKVRNEELEGETLKKGEVRELKLVLEIKNTKEARNYINKVTVKGEVYEKVNYIVDNELYKEEEVLEGEKIKEISMPEKNGVKFSGWYTDKNYTNRYNFEKEVTKDIILYGKYEEAAKKYIVKFIDDGKLISTKEYEEGSIIEAPEDPSKEGYTFKYWSLQENGEEYNILTPVKEDITLYSVYEINKYDVVFKNYNEDVLQEEKVEYGSTPTYKGETPTRESTEEYRYEFSGWKPEIHVVKDNQEYKAKYNQIKMKYTLRYEDENGSKIKEESYDYGSVVVLENAEEKEGKIFEGWYNKETSLKEETVTITKNITVVSRYKDKTYTVKFYDNGEELEELRKENVVHGTSIEKPEYEPSKEDYNFAGWVKKGTSEKYVFGTPVTEDIELESTYTNKATYEVRFNIDGVDDALESQTVIDGKKASRPTPEPSKKGYIFDGWYKDSSYLEKYDFETPVTGDITLYGRYNENAHTVTYKNENEVYEEEKVLDTYKATGPKKGNPSKEGYTFKYWSLDEEGEEYVLESHEITEDITLYAVYEINTYNVVFKNYDDTILQQGKVEYGQMPKYTNEEPTREKTDEYTYTFKGWSPQLHEVTSDQEYKAEYLSTKNKYEITFVDYDGEELQKEELEYGSMPTYKSEDPTREETPEYKYEFSGWSPEIEEVTKNQTYEAQYNAIKKEYTVRFEDEDNSLIEEKKIQYGEEIIETTLREEKEHKIFLYWTKDGEEYQLEGKTVTEDITLVAKYELVEKPVISHSPEEWTNQKVTVTIKNESHPEYSFKYKKQGEEEYTDYSDPFDVLENTTITGKSIKQEVESELEIHPITNIDKDEPELTSFEITSQTTSGFNVEINVKDVLSGVKEIRVYVDGVLKDTIEGTKTTEDNIVSSQITELEELHTYKVKLEVDDVAGNTLKTEEKDGTTIGRIIVAKIIGRNGELNSKLIEDEINEEKSKLEEEQELPAEKEQEIREKHKDEEYESLDLAVKACGDSQCTIQMVLGTNESVEVLQNQDITLDINGKEIKGVRDYTIQNDGKLIIIDNGETRGEIKNENDTSIKNIEGGILTLGINDEERNVSKERPNIVGSNKGIDNKGTFNFYDGRVEGQNAAIQGKVNDTPYLYNATVESGATQVATLSVVADAEVKMDSTYYTNVHNSMNEAKKGSYTQEEIQSENLTKFAETPENELYGFKYNEDTQTLTSTNQYKNNTTAHSYIYIDLREYEEDQYLRINASVSSESGDIGYAIVTNDNNVPSQNQISDLIYISEEKENREFVTFLKAGSEYYLHLGYYKNYLNASGTDTFTINSIKMGTASLLKDNIEVKQTGSYGFKFIPELVPTNITETGQASAYIMIDLENEEEDKEVTINAEGISINSNSYSFIKINNDENVPTYWPEDRIYYCNNQTCDRQDYKGTLKAHQKNYIHIVYNNPNNTHNKVGIPFKINSIIIDGENILEANNQITNYKKNVNVPVLNEEKSTIELLRPLSLTSPIEVESARSVELDLKGQTLTTQTTDYIIKNNGDLTITDSKYAEDVASAQKKYEEDVKQNKLEYDAAMEEYNQNKEKTQLAYDVEYNSEIEKAIEKKENGYTTDDYVKENLVLQLDGIDHGEEDGKWKDLSNNNHDGTISEAVWTEDNGLSFDGSNDYVSIGELNNSNITLETVFSNKQTKTRVEIGSNNSVGGYSLALYSGKVKGYIRISNSNYELTSKTSIDLNKKYHAVLTYDGSIIKLYVNGILEDSRAAQGTITNPTTSTYFMLGAFPNGNKGNGNYLNGIIYSFRMYDKALTEEEINKNYKVEEERYNVGNDGLTSNTSYGEVKSDSGVDPYKVFDKNKETTFENEVTGESTIEWNLPEEKTITSFKIYGNDISKYPKSVELKGSKDGETYETLVLKDDLEAKGLNEYNEITIEKNKYDSYKYFKWILTNEENTISISEIEPEMYDVIHRIYKEVDNKYKIEAEDTHINLGSIVSFNSYSGEKGVDNAYDIDFDYYVYDNLNNDAYLNIYGEYFTRKFEVYLDNQKIEFENTINNNNYTNLKINIGKLPNGNHKITLKQASNSSVPRYDYFVVERENKPMLKQAVLADSPQQGNIISSTGNVIYNAKGANLLIDKGIININKQGTSNAYTTGIMNYGSLTLNKYAIINNNVYYASAIDNLQSGDIKESSGTINVNDINNTDSYAIRNYSIVDEEIKGLNISLSNNRKYGLLHTSTKDIVLDKLNITGDGIALYMNTPNTLTLEDNNITAYNLVNTNSTRGTLTINDGIINTSNNSIFLNSSDFTLNISSGKIITQNSGVYISGPTVVNMTNGEIESNNSNARNSLIYNNGGTVSITGGKVSYKVGYIIDNENSGQTIISGDFKVDENSSGLGIYNTNATLTIDGNAQILGNNDYGVRNTNNGTVDIKGNAVINATTSGIYNTNSGTVTIGEKDSTVSEEYPKIISAKYGVDNVTNASINRLATINWYDGQVIGSKNNGINGSITESEPEYDLYIQDEKETLEKITLKVPNLEIFGNVAKIDSNYYPSIQSALKTLDNNEEKEITILKDIRTIVQNNVPEETKATIDINGKEIKSYNSSSLVNNTGTLKIVDNQNKFGENGYITSGTGQMTTILGKLIENSGTLEIDGGKLNSTIGTIVNTNTLKITSGLVTSTAIFSDSLSTIENKETGNIQMTGGSLEKSSNSYYAIIKTSSSGNIDIKGGKLTAQGSNGDGIENTGSGTITLDGGNITTNRGINSSAGNVVISNSTISSSISINNTGTSLLKIDGENTNITGGITNGSSSSTVVDESSVIIDNGTITGQVQNNANGTITINDGKISLNNSSTGSSSATIYNRGTGIINIKGGRVTSTKNPTVANDKGTIALGIKGDMSGEELNVSQTNPEIKSTNGIGVLNTGTFNFYDGIVKGTSAISGSVNEVEDGYDVVIGKEDTLETKYLDKVPILKNTTKSKEYYDFDSAISDASAGDTLQVMRNITVLATSEPTTISQDKNIILDINGKTITTGNELFMKNEGTLTIKDSQNQLDGNGYIESGTGEIISTSGKVIENNGTLEIDGGKLSSPLTTIVNKNVLNITKGLVTSIIVVQGNTGTTIENKETGSIKMTGGSLEASVNASGSSATIINTSSSGNIDITGGKLISTDRNGYSNSYGIENTGTGTITLKGVSLTVDDRGINSSAGKVVINNSTISSRASRPSIANTGTSLLRIDGEETNIIGLISNSSAGTEEDSVIIDNGTITGNLSNTSSGKFTINNGTITGNLSNTSSGVLHITGGKINGKVSNVGTLILGIKGDMSDEQLNVSQTNPEIKSTNGIGISNTGTFNFYDGIVKGTSAIDGSVNEVEDGYDVVIGSEEALETKYLDKVPILRNITQGNEEYYDFDSAISDADKGDTLEVMRNVTILSTAETITISQDKNIILDINGKTVTSGNELFMKNEGKLKIKDSQNTIGDDETITGGTGQMTTILGKLIENSGTLEIDGGKLNSSSTTIVNTNELKMTKGLVTSTAVNRGDTVTTIENKETGSIKMTGGSLEASVNASGLSATIINTSSSGNIDIIGGKLTATLGNYATLYGIENTGSGTITLNEGNIATTNRGINSSAGKVVINNSTISSNIPITNTGTSLLRIQGEKTNITAPYTLQNAISNSSVSTEEDSVIIDSGTITGQVSNTGSGTITIDDGTINGPVINVIEGKLIINSGEFLKISNSGLGIVDINGGTITSPTDPAISNSDGTVNVSNVNLDNVETGISQNRGGTVNIDQSVVINATNVGVYNGSTGTINIGKKDGSVIPTEPSIKGTNYGLQNINASGKINFYDGIITGASNQSMSGTTNEVEPGYKVKRAANPDGTESATLELIGDTERVLQSGGLNYTDLQAAINAAGDEETEMILYDDINLTSDIIVPSGKTIKLRLNGHEIIYNDHQIKGEGKFITIDQSGSEHNILGSIVNLVKNALNIDTNEINKNIVVYEMNDGSKLQSNKTYKLYKDGKQVKVEEGDSLGRYIIGNIEEEMKTVRGRIYLNNLSSGEYEVIDNDGKKIGFTITETGEVYGSVRESVNTQRVLVASAISELILSIQTGMTSIKYLLLISLVSIIIVLLVIIQRKKSSNI